MNEQELFERFDRISAALEQMAGGVERSTETISYETTARREMTAEEIVEARKKKALSDTAQREEYAYQARLRKNFDDLGISIKTYKEGNEVISKIEKSRVSDMKARQAAEAELNKILEENTSDFKNLSKSAKEKYKNDLKNEAAMTKAYASTGRYYDATGKLVKETDGLTAAQRVHISILQEHDRVLQQMGGNVAQFGMDLGKLAITSTFNMFAAGIRGAYEGVIAFQNAILDGAGANAAAAAQISAEANALAGALESVGSNMISLGAEAAKTALSMIILGGPIGILVGILMLLVGAAVAYEGYEKQSQAAKIKRDAELNAKQAAIYDQLYLDFTQLSQASLTGAGGMTTLWEQLGKVGMAVKDFAKFNRILVESASAMATFSSSVVEGVQKFTDVAGGIIHSGLGKIFRQMGMTNEDIADHTAKSMEQQTRLGLMQGKSIADIQKGTASYIFELDRVATLTGQSRKEQEKARDAVKQIQQLRAAQFMARDRGDTKEANRLLAIENFATAMMKYDPQLATGIVKKGVGAAIDNDVVMAMRALPNAMKALDNGTHDTATLLLMAGKGIEAQQRAYAPSIKIQGNIEGIANMLGDDLVLQTTELNKKIDEAKKLGQYFDPAKYLDKLRAVTDPFTKSQENIQWLAKQTQIAFEKNVKGLSTELPNILGEAMNKYLPEALRGPIFEFFKYVEAFGRYVMKLLNDPSDTLAETFTGKDKSQRDAEKLIEKQKELKATEERIKSLKESTENTEKAKKLADEKFKLAEQELKLKEQAVAELNKKIAPGNWKPGATEEEKRLQAKEKEKLAIQGAAIYKEQQEAKARYDLAKKAVDDNDTGFFGKSIESKKKELVDLEKKKLGLTNETLKLEQQVKSNPASTTAAGFAKTFGSNPAYSMAMAGGGNSGSGGAGAMGAGDPSGGGSTAKPELTSVRSKSGPSAMVNKNVANSFQNLIDHLDTAGYKINDLGGYNDRDVRGQPGVKSAHAKGAALDINEKTNPMSPRLITDLPEDIGKIAGNLGLGWGGNWQIKKDAMHFSAARNEGGTLMARNGGVFNGPPGGYPVELHGREAIVPLPNPGDKISINKAQKDGSATKDALSSVMADNATTSSNGSGILIDLYTMMESKFDDLIDKVNTTNNYTNKLLKYSQV